MIEVGFRYGPLAPTLEEQANTQGFTLKENAELYEKLRESITRLMFANILTDSQVNKAFQKLQNQLVRKLKPLGGVNNE